MTINRAPFNALYDDDGSGLVGSVWNKSAIQSTLLDPIDGDPVWVDVPYDGANFGTGAGGSWYVPAGNSIQKYAIKGKTVSILVSVKVSHIYVGSYQLTVGGWPFTVAPTSVFIGQTWLPAMSSHSASGSWGAVLVGLDSSNRLDFRRTNFSDWPVTGDDFSLDCALTLPIV